MIIGTAGHIDHSKTTLIKANSARYRATNRISPHAIPFVVSSANGAYRTMSGGWRLTQ